MAEKEGREAFCAGGKRKRKPIRCKDLKLAERGWRRVSVVLRHWGDGRSQTARKGDTGVRRTCDEVMLSLENLQKDQTSSDCPEGKSQNR